MKKIIYYINISLFALIAFTACQSDEDVNGQKEKGYMTFDVSVDHNPEIIVTRAAVADVDTFKVEIIGDKGYTEKFDSYAALKAAGILELVPDEYTVKAYSTEDAIKPVSTYPTYGGETKDITVAPGIATDVMVECVMREIEIGLDLSQLLIPEVSELKAFIYSEGILLHEFGFGTDGITDTRYFKPDESLEILLTGKYGEYDLGTLGEGLFINKAKDKDGQEIEIKGNVSLTVTIIGIEPEEESGLAIKRPISFNLQTIATK